MQKNEFRCNAFKAYDIRGKVPDELNEETAYRIGLAYIELFKAKKVVVGYDVRQSSLSLSNALIRGLMNKGCEVVSLGLCGTEQVYFATFYLNLDGGIMITASHNPREYNGMKLIGSGAKPISGDSGLRELEQLVINADFNEDVSVNIHKGSCKKIDLKDEYIKHLLGYVNINSLKFYKVVVNAGNGCAGPIIDALEEFLPINFIKVNNEPDGSFPNGIPNPLLPENRGATAQVVRETGADVGIAWDGDFDRCFLFDEEGKFIEGYYIVGLLASIFLKRYPGAKIIHDPRLTWNTIDLVQQLGGIPVQSKTGHAFIKERMRLEDAIYGGEMSAHHYFKAFAYCDSGMIPWLLILELMSKENKTLSQLINERIACYPASGEINRKVKNPLEIMQRVEQEFATEKTVIDRTDGLSMEMDNWRFNLRMSNTETVLRLNLETKGNAELMKQKTEELLRIIDN
jgi:phosphomannomutase/phosphomannomutase/phosphoglucomutase